jgi:hypothetical protein
MIDAHTGIGALNLLIRIYMFNPICREQWFESIKVGVIYSVLKSECQQLARGGYDFSHV